MKLVLVNSLNTDEVLARDVVSSAGKILVTAGSKVTPSMVQNLIYKGVNFIYIKDGDLDDIDSFNDETMRQLKSSTLQALPHMFDDVISGNDNSLHQSMNVVYDLVDYIQSNSDIDLNLYEVKSYDTYTYAHSIDTAVMAIFLGSSLKLDKSTLRELATSAIFHDIGKTKIPNYIINKPGKLTDKEFEYMKLHPFYGKEILCKNPRFSERIISGVAQHHEKYNGKGYPFKLKDPEISYFAKIISVCDVFSALTSDRVYRRKFNPKEAYELILSEAEVSFHPSIVKCFKDTFAIYPIGCGVTLSNNCTAYVVKQNAKLPDRPIVRVIKDQEGRKVKPYDIDLKSTLNIVIKNSIYK